MMKASVRSAIDYQPLPSTENPSVLDQRDNVMVAIHQSMAMAKDRCSRMERCFRTDSSK